MSGLTPESSETALFDRDSVQDRSRRVYVCCLSACGLAAVMTVISPVQDSCHCLICLIKGEYCCESRQMHTMVLTLL